MVDVEDMIVSGLISNSLDVEQFDELKVSNVTLVKTISQISKEVKPKDYLRIIMIYLACFDLPPKDKSTLLKSLAKESFRDMLNNLELIDSSMAFAKKFRRKQPMMSQKELQ
jgi:hypothetical protein